MRIRTKLFLPLLGFSLLFLGYAHFHWLPGVTAQVMVHSEENLRAHLRSVAEGLVPLLLENQLANVHDNLDALLAQNADWRYLGLTDADGRRLYPLTDRAPPPASDTLRHLSQPIGFLGPSLGELVLAVDLEPVRREATALEWRLRAVLLFLVTAFVLVMAGVTEWLVGRKITRLALASDRLANGDYEAPLPPPGRDEIGSLIQSFATMRESLGAFHGRLRGEIEDHRRTAHALRREKQRVSYQATHDALTGLINRAELERRVSMALDLARRDGTTHVLLYLDLDQFKLVNDTCGHMAGDALLQQITALLQERVRRHDTLARLGGDELGVLLEHCALGDAMEVAENLRRTVQDFQFAWEDKIFRLGVSIGAVRMDAASGDGARILSQADAACYAAKDLGRNRVQLYQEDDHELARQRGDMDWAARLAKALQDDRFVLHCQPILALVPGTADPPLFHEVLIRLRERDGTLVPPGAFIPAAERYGLIPAIDRWVFDRVESFLDGLPPGVPIQLSVNLSGPSLGDGALLEHIETRIRRRGAGPAVICFEITESAAVRNLAAARRFIKRLRRHGSRFALDDFGSGMSSFTYLKSLPVNYLKIAGTFVRDIGRDPVSLALVGAIHEVARVMGIQTVAEYVEDATILERLRRMGVSYGQGFHLGRPFPLEELGAATRDEPSTTAAVR